MDAFFPGKNIDKMDPFSSTMSVHLVSKVKSEPETNIYETKYLPSYCNSPCTPKPENMSLQFLKELKIESDEKYTLEVPLYVPVPDDRKMKTSEFVPGCDQIFPNKAKTLVKIETSETTAYESDVQLNDVKFDDWKIKNDEPQMKEEGLEPTEPSILSSEGGSSFQPVHKSQQCNPVSPIYNLREHRFNCDQCKYKTRYIGHLKAHILHHRDPKDIKRFKCDHCDYKTNHKSHLKSHIRRHKNVDKVIRYICDHCDYQTIYAGNLKKHLIRHKNPEELLLRKTSEELKRFKCDHCDFRSVQKSNLTSHLIRHKDPKEVDKFNCDKCGYQTIYKGDLKKHLLRHKNPEEVNMFKCDQCSYQTIYKNAFKNHLFHHKNPEDVSTFQCDMCHFKSIYRGNLNKHLLLHKSAEEVNRFKCNRCNYVTIYKYDMKKHIFRHEKL